jgi:hypothetical protein
MHTEVTVGSVPVSVPLRKLLTPSILSGALVVWTAAVYPFSAYGDSWAIWPALLVFPIVVIWHCALIFKFRGNRLNAFIAALAHLSLLSLVWFSCLMLISKDSL